jgi:sugar transferase (PEP-CTERM system associated)
MRKIFGHYAYLPMLFIGVAEALAVVVACWVTWWIESKSNAIFLAGKLPFALDRCLLLAACSFLSLMAMGLYNKRLRDGASGVLVRIAIGLVCGAVAARVVSLIWPDLWFPGWAIVRAIIATMAMVTLVRLVGQHLMDAGAFRRRVLVLGSGLQAERVLRLRRRADQRGFKVVGFVPMAGDATTLLTERLVAAEGSLLECVRAHRVDEIVVAMDDRRGRFPVQALLECRLAGVEVNELVSFLERETGKVFLDVVSPSWIILGGGFRCNWPRRVAVRAFDIVASLLILSVGCPLMILAAIAIKIEDGLSAPVFYFQERVGLRGLKFRVYKFRSMHLNAEVDGKACWAKKNDSRITSVGAVIRKTRMDELPQLFNVLSGKMSFVGPRPERPAFVSRLSETIPYYVNRHSVKPGITGWAQLCYPYGSSDQDAVEKLQYDLFYIKNNSFIFDFLILLQTVEVILFGKGAR